MKKAQIIIACGIIMGTTLFNSSCKKDEDAPKPTISLSSQSLQTESGKTVDATVNFTAAAGFDNLKITKTVNNAADPKFGQNGVLTAEPTSTGTNAYQYTFSYVADTSDVGKLVGFNFKVTDKDKNVVESDLTLQVNLSPRDNLTRKSWKCYSVPMWTTANTTPEEVGAAIDFDNVLTFNIDSTYKMNWGAIKGTFDDFFTPVKWWMEGDTVMYRSVSNVFTAEVTKTKYFVTELTLTQITLEERDVDMTPLGGQPHTTFAYKYKAILKE